MRIVFVGASDTALQAIERLIQKSHEVVLIEEDEKRIEQLRDRLDCGFLHGDGSNPELLQETNPKSVDSLIAMTNEDQDNIIVGLVGKSLGFKQVVVKVRNVSYEKVCNELGLEHVIVPSRTIGRSLVDLIENQDAPELKDYFKKDAALLKCVIKESQSVEQLDLPKNAHVICLYRDEKFRLLDGDGSLKEGDELIILTEKGEKEGLSKRLNPSD